MQYYLVIDVALQFRRHEEITCAFVDLEVLTNTYITYTTFAFMAHGASKPTDEWTKLRIHDAGTNVQVHGQWIMCDGYV